MHRRRSERIEVLGKASCSVLTANGDRHPVALVNVSMGGLMLHSPAPVAGLGDVIEVEIRLGKDVKLRSPVKVVEIDPTEAHALEGAPDKAVIRWIDGRGGNFGVEFMDLDGRKKKALEKLLKEFE